MVEKKEVKNLENQLSKNLPSLSTKLFSKMLLFYSFL